MRIGRDIDGYECISVASHITDTQKAADAVARSRKVATINFLSSYLLALAVL